ncbi:MAG: hypothetical protein V3U73_15680 [bacterium]
MMMRAFIKFNKGLLKQPFHVQLWLVLLVAVNLVIPLFYLGRIEARVVALTFLIAAALMTVLTALSGFSRLLGLGHFVWFPLLYFLWTGLEQIPADDFFGIWVRVLMILNAISLVIDVVDVIRYIAGDREETVEGL